MDQYTFYPLFAYALLGIRVRQLPLDWRTWSRTRAKILMYVAYLDKYQKDMYQMSLPFLSDFPKNFSLACSYWNKMKDC